MTTFKERLAALTEDEAREYVQDHERFRRDSIRLHARNTTLGTPLYDEVEINPWDKTVRIDTELDDDAPLDERIKEFWRHVTELDEDGGSGPPDPGMICYLLRISEDDLALRGAQLLAESGARGEVINRQGYTELLIDGSVLTSRLKHEKPKWYEEEFIKLFVPPPPPPKKPSLAEAIVQLEDNELTADGRDVLLGWLHGEVEEAEE